MLTKIEEIEDSLTEHDAVWAWARMKEGKIVKKTHEPHYFKLFTNCAALMYGNGEWSKYNNDRDEEFFINRYPDVLWCVSTEEEARESMRTL